MPSKKKPDCQRCGACCVNALRNREIGFKDWVQIEPGERIFRDKKLTKRLVVLDHRGVPHMDMKRHRCVALEGRLGRRVNCTIYGVRPRVCRAFEAGSRHCLNRRKELGISS